VLFPAAELKYHLKKPQWPQPAPESCKSSEKTRRHKGRQRIEHDRTTLSLLPLTQCQPLTEKVAKEVWNIVHYTIYKYIYIYLFIYLYVYNTLSYLGGGVAYSYVDPKCGVYTVSSFSFIQTFRLDRYLRSILWFSHCLYIRPQKSNLSCAPNASHFCMCHWWAFRNLKRQDSLV